MVLKRRMSGGLGALRRREVLAGDRLPYSALVDENVVLLRDGSVMVSLMVPGHPFETAASEEFNGHAATRKELLRSALDARFMLYHHVVRRQVNAAMEADFPDPLSAHIDARWRERTGSGALFVNDQFVTLVRRPAHGNAGWAEKLSRVAKRSGDREMAAEPEDVRALHAAADSLTASLTDYGARLLGNYEGASGPCSEVLELLSALYNGEMRPVRCPAEGADIGHMLPYRRASFGLDALELRGASTSVFGAIVSLKDYPDTTTTGLTDVLLRLPCELVLSESYAPAADSAAFGDHHLSVMIRASSLDALDMAAADCAAALADAGAIAVREDVSLEPAFWGQMPGNEQYLLRRSPISSANMASFGSLHGFATGQASGNHWGEAVTLMTTTSATPFFFNFHSGDLGNFTVIGPSGSGKTVVMNFLAAQAQKFSPRTILFDKDRSGELLMRGIGGTYSRIAKGDPTGFNPLALPDNPANRAFLRDWLGELLQADGPQESAIIAGAVDAAYANDPSLRRLRHFRELLAGSSHPEPGDLPSRLDRWIADGELGWLFDNAHDSLDMVPRVLGFDMTALLESPRLRTPVMMYLFHRIEEQLDGKPTMILIDEGWKALDDPLFSARTRDWLKTMRRGNALVGFAAQSARDALDSRIAGALIEQTATMIFTPNARARAEDYCGGFALTDHELEVIRTLPAHSRCFLVRQADASVVVRLDLSGMPEVLTVLSGRSSSLRQFDALRERYGDAPAAWYPALTGASWPGEQDSESAGSVWTEAAE